LGLAANLIVTILLSPAIFGIYITVLSLINVLNYFSDIGLAASLVQKKEISSEDISTTFTMQQILIISAITLGFFASNLVRTFYKLPVEGIYLYWALLAGFFISSLKTIPSIFLERKIQFQKIVLVQIIENTVFYITVMVLAFAKAGLTSFTVAVLLRAIVGLIAIYRISPWTPRFGISKSSLRHLLSFGLPFQASSFLALFKDDLITLFLSKILGFEGVGYIGWAKKWAEAPIRIIMDNISRVLFPVFARIQHDKEKISQLVEKILFYQTTLLAPTILGAALLMHRIILFVPKYGKWAPAIPLFYLFCYASFFSSYSSPFINLFNALGYARIPFAFMIFWTVLTWIGTPILSALTGLYGFPLTVAVLATTSIAVMFKARSLVGFRFVASVYKPFVSAIVMGCIVSVVLFLIPQPLLSVLVAGVLGCFSYVGIMYYLKINLYTEITKLFRS